MKAFVLEERGKAILKDMPKPVLESPYGAILHPIAVAPCTSDVNTVYGSGSKKPDDLILGHECVAKVVEVGDMVRDFKVGDIVAVPAVTPDYRSVEIQEGNDRHAGKPFSANALGRSVPGVFAEYFAIADADLNLAKVPDHVSVKDALMCVDVMTTGYTGAEEAEIKTGDTVVVYGIGAIGLAAISGAVHMGAARVIAIGSRGICVERAKAYGANEVLNYKTTDVVKEVLAMTDGIGADVVIICGGDDSAMPQSIDMVRYGIGRVVNLKLYSGDGAIEIPKFSGGRGMSGKTVKFELCKGGRARIERMLKMVLYGRIKPQDLITHELHGLESIGPALDMMRTKSDDLIKVMVTLD